MESKLGVACLDDDSISGFAYRGLGLCLCLTPVSSILEQKQQVLNFMFHDITTAVYHEDEIQPNLGYQISNFRHFNFRNSCLCLKK